MPMKVNVSRFEGFTGEYESFQQAKDNWSSKTLIEQEIIRRRWGELVKRRGGGIRRRKRTRRRSRKKKSRAKRFIWYFFLFYFGDCITSMYTMSTGVSFCNGLYGFFRNVHLIRCIPFSLYLKTSMMQNSLRYKLYQYHI